MYLNTMCDSLFSSIGENDFDDVFLLVSPETLSQFRCKLFCNR